MGLAIGHAAGLTLTTHAQQAWLPITRRRRSPRQYGWLSKDTSVVLDLSSAPKFWWSQIGSNSGKLS